MTRQIISSIIFIILLASQVLAQAPDTEWTRTYNLGPGTSIREINEGGYVLSCDSYFYSSLGSIFKIDANGDSIWAANINDFFGSGMNFVTQGLDGNLLIVGWAMGMFYGPHLIAFSFDGNGNYINGGYGEEFSIGRWAEPLSDSGFILLGRSLGFGGREYGLLLQRTGHNSWYKHYSHFNYDYPGSVKPTRDGGFIISASTPIDTARHSDGYLIRTDSFGDTIWTKTYGGIADDWFSELEQTADGGFIITGYTSSYGIGGSDIWAVRTDSLGDTLWTRTYGTAQNDGGSSIKKIQSGGYIISGSMAGRACLLRIDDNGDSLWTKTCDGATSAASIALTSDGGYAITGTWEPSDSLPPQLWVAKLAPDRTKIDDDHYQLPKNSFIAWNYPNPFNSSTMISWSGSDVERIEIFNIMGQKIRPLSVETNNITKIVWDAKDSRGSEIGAGVYFARVIGKENSATIKLIYLK